MLILYVVHLLLGASPNLALTTLASVETRDGKEWKNHIPKSCVTPPIETGSRLRVQTKASAKSYLYAIAQDQNRSYWLLSKKKPSPQPVRQLWPEGYILSSKDSKMQTLLIVASEKPIESLESLKTAHCPQWKTKFPPKQPQTLCDHLGTLSREAPRRVRGCVEHETDLLRDGNSMFLGIQSKNSAQGRVVTEHLFRPTQP